MRVLPRRARGRRRRAASHGHADLRSCGRNGIRARRPACEAGGELRGLPQDPIVCRGAPRVQLVPYRCAQGRARNRLHALSLDENSVQGVAQPVRPYGRSLPVDRRASRSEVREMSQDQRLSWHGVRHLLGVPRESARQEIPGDLHVVSHDREMGHPQRRPLENELPPGWRARRGDLREVSPVGGDDQTFAVQSVFSLPRERASRQPEGRLPRVPHRDRVSGSGVRPCQPYGVRARRQARRRRLPQVPHRYFRARGAAGTESGGLRRRPARVRRVSWRQGSAQR